MHYTSWRGAQSGPFWVDVFIGRGLMLILGKCLRQPLTILPFNFIYVFIFDCVSFSAVAHSSPLLAEKQSHNSTQTPLSWGNRLTTAQGGWDKHTWVPTSSKEAVPIECQSWGGVVNEEFCRKHHEWLSACNEGEEMTQRWHHHAQLDTAGISIDRGPSL